ncbi:hypothetical protein [Deinococcus multiflagellatus]|uniref:Cache domain-containing protein n=1 Tax=Deinococcus multiflagellatus TaxID=1656887 RepID=A0ABW1ZKD9_9DEIO
MSAPPSSLPQWRPRTSTQALRAFAASRAWLLAALLLTQALTLAAALWAEGQVQARARRAQAQTNLSQLAQLTALSVQTSLQEAAHMVRLGEANLRAGLLRPDDAAQTLQSFGALLDSVPQLGGVMTAGPDGRFVFARRDGPQGQGRFTRVIEVRPARRVTNRTTDAAGRLLLQSRADEGYDPRTRPWYALARAHPGQVVWTEPYVFASSQAPGVTAAVAGPGGVVVGADVQLQQLVSLLQGLPLPPRAARFWPTPRAAPSPPPGRGRAKRAACRCSRPWPTPRCRPCWTPRGGPRCRGRSAGSRWKASCTRRWCSRWSCNPACSGWWACTARPTN